LRRAPQDDGGTGGTSVRHTLVLRGLDRASITLQCILHEFVNEFLSRIFREGESLRGGTKAKLGRSGAARTRQFDCLKCESRGRHGSVFGAIQTATLAARRFLRTTLHNRERAARQLRDGPGGCCLQLAQRHPLIVRRTSSADRNTRQSGMASGDATGPGGDLRQGAFYDRINL
jgi:hypothetical protein